MAPYEDGLTFSTAPEVTRSSVRYQNRYGIEIAADLYLPKRLDESAKHPAIVIGPPYGGVKEQGPGVYGNELARRGFVAVAFDPSYNGESGGEPRHVSSPDIFAEDFSAGVDYLGTLPFVDRERIGAIGICGSGGFALNAAQVDPRIRAVATSAMYDISRVSRNGWLDSQSDDERRAGLEVTAAQRWADVDAGKTALTPVFPDEFKPESLDPVTSEFQEYYVTDRGHHPRSIGGFTVTSSLSHINLGPLAHLQDIAPRPILLITGEYAHSRYFSDTVYAQAAEPKELIVVPGARHIDLYDRTDLIPFDTLESFFTKSLISGNRPNGELGRARA
ncbi:alpha/beta hydrolase [Arthrobacter sp. CDRTa11]|uniref:alpha/beta hydrolase n=1 Tax=Arthrobacter sp. CDRTa11 TaxID=2651199 RepID=UPI002265A9EC|nr:alpha/beta hydrolase [Arthrobacter sp. CDRTa11]UZX02996.1 alpha/beta hydrolase [Arthrobacter sp. CDRTa11]